MALHRTSLNRPDTMRHAGLDASDRGVHQTAEMTVLRTIVFGNDAIVTIAEMSIVRQYLNTVTGDCSAVLM